MRVAPIPEVPRREPHAKRQNRTIAKLPDQALFFFRKNTRFCRNLTGFRTRRDAYSPWLSRMDRTSSEELQASNLSTNPDVRSVIITCASHPRYSLSEPEGIANNTMMFTVSLSSASNSIPLLLMPTPNEGSDISSIRTCGMATRLKPVLRTASRSYNAFRKASRSVATPVPTMVSTSRVGSLIHQQIRYLRPPYLVADFCKPGHGWYGERRVW